MPTLAQVFAGVPLLSDEEEKPAARRFSVEGARKQAEEALHKSEFILSRAYGLLKSPKSEWEQIRAEQTTIPAILIGYVAPLAAIQPICDIIGKLIFGQLASDSAMGLAALPQALVGGVIFWVVSVAIVGLLGVIVNAAAPHFDADGDDLGAQKIAAYSMTPFYLSGVLLLWPPLGWLGVVGLAAAVYVMYCGLPILMKAPEDRALGYAATVTIAAMVAGIILLAIAFSIV
ncbi:MAG TPA: Yip1 family protein [Terricaulis sp.]|nr:Yip1 family protein [Terricaulis sp.]